MAGKDSRAPRRRARIADGGVPGDGRTRLVARPARSPAARPLDSRGPVHRHAQPPRRAGLRGHPVRQTRRVRRAPALRSFPPPCCVPSNPCGREGHSAMARPNRTEDRHVHALAAAASGTRGEPRPRDVGQPANTPSHISSARAMPEWDEWPATSDHADVDAKTGRRLDDSQTYVYTAGPAASTTMRSRYPHNGLTRRQPTEGAGNRERQAPALHRAKRRGRGLGVRGRGRRGQCCRRTVGPAGSSARAGFGVGGGARGSGDVGPARPGRSAGSAGTRPYDLRPGGAQPATAGRLGQPPVVRHRQFGAPPAGATGAGGYGGDGDGRRPRVAGLSARTTGAICTAVPLRWRRRGKAGAAAGRSRP